MMAIFSKSETEKLQAKLASLEKKRITLSGRLVSAQAAELAAIEARRRHLVESDDIDLSSGAKLAAAVDAAQRDRLAIEDAIEELDRLIAEGRAAIITAKEGAARTKRASEIETKIKKIETLAAQAERQFESLVATLEKIATEGDDPALDVKEYRELQGHVDRLQVTSIIGASLAQAIFRDAPDLMTVEKSFGASFARAVLPMMIARHDGLSRDLPIDHGDENSFTPKPLSGALQANLIEPLRTAAKEILSGERPITTTAKIIADDDEAEPVMEYRRLVFVRPVRWTDWRGETITTSDSDQTVPVVVAEAAIRAGAAFEHQSKEAEAHLDRRYQRGFHGDAVTMNKEIIDLHVRWLSTTKAAA